MEYINYQTCKKRTVKKKKTTVSPIFVSETSILLTTRSGMGE